MRLKTFRAFSLSEALDAVQEDLGPTASILHTRTFKQGGFLGLGSRDVVEVIASEARDGAVEQDTTPTEEPAAASEVVSTPEIGQRQAARRAYARVEGDVPPVADSSSARSATLEVDRDRTRRLAQAMAIRLEKQQAARRAAGVSSSGDLLTGAEPNSSPAAASETAATGETGVMHQADLESAPMEDTPTEDAPTADVVAEATTEPRPTQKTDRFIIGAGGVLIPDVDAGLESVAASSVSTESEETMAEVSVSEVPDLATGLPTDGTPDIDSNEDRRDVESMDVFASEESPRVVCLDDGPVLPSSGSGVPVVSVAADQIDAGEIETSETSEGSGQSLGRDSGRMPESEDLAAIRNTVGRVLEPFSTDAAPSTTPLITDGTDAGDPLAGAYATLIGQELSRDLADQVVSELETTLESSVRRDPVQVRAAVLEQLAGLIPTEESIGWASPRDGRPRTIAFVGPTGVGKTTTLAKIAATLVLREKLSVGLVTADTYRISAVDQLKTYADILGARIEVAADPQGMREAMRRCGDLDAVLVDTPGRSQNDADRLAELRGLMDAAQPHETHLVLSGTASERVLLREAEAFSRLGPDRVVLTKLDEAVAFGMLVSVVRRIGRRISWVTTGQEVPRDVEHATGARLASLVLGGAVR